VTSSTIWAARTGISLAACPLTVESGSDPRGVFWSVRTPVEVPADFYQYKYEVELENGTSRQVTDPCARYGGLGDQNSGLVVGGSRPADNVVRPLAGGRKPLTDLTIYELMVDDFTRSTVAPVHRWQLSSIGLTACATSALRPLSSCPGRHGRTRSSTGDTNRFTTSPWRRACYVSTAF
jgi:hypothetical protein